jgi:hypothetical protein
MKARVFEEVRWGVLDFEQKKRQEGRITFALLP